MEQEDAVKTMTVLFLGVTIGVAVMRATETGSASQLRLMAFFFGGVLLGMTATAICLMGWRE